MRVRIRAGARGARLKEAAGRLIHDTERRTRRRRKPRGGLYMIQSGARAAEGEEHSRAANAGQPSAADPSPG